MRDSTERSEAVSAGFAKLVGAKRERIVREALALLGDDAYSPPSTDNPFGDGKASERIVSRLKGELDIA